MIYYSQFDEDKIIFDLFSRKKIGCCVEVGANNGIDDSTTFFFEKIGWKCILVEPNPDLCDEIRKVRQGRLFECAVSNKKGQATLYIAEGAERSHGVSTLSDKKEDQQRIRGYGFQCKPIKVKVKTLDDILKQSEIDCEIDFISIDVEGLELEVLNGFSIEKWKPRIMMVEDNYNLENKSVKKYLKKHNYITFNRTGVNDWYAHSSDKQFINLKSKFRILCIYTDKKITKTIKTIKNTLKKIPILVKLHRLIVNKETSIN